MQCQTRGTRNTQMPSPDDPRLDQLKFFVMYAKLISIQYGTLINVYRYNDVKRMIEVHGDDIEARGVDSLGAQLVEGVKALPKAGRGRDAQIDPPASLASLFQEHELARSLKPKLWLAFDLQDDKATICGLLTACDFVCDNALSTSKLTQAYCTQHQLPRLDASWQLIDVVASDKRGSAALMLLNCIIAATRAKKTGLVSIAVTAGGRNLFESCGFNVSHSWKERGGMRTLAHCKMNNIHLGVLHTRLRLHNRMLDETCVREGLTPRTSDRLIGRCT